MTELKPGDSRVAFIGLGAMGMPMARRLSGHFLLHLHDADTAALAEWERAPVAGTEAFADLAEAAGGVDAAVLMLPDSVAVEAVVPTLLGVLSPGAFIVDMSSSDPISTRSLGDRARELGIGYVDAPVSGGVVGAEAGALTAIVGGQECGVRAVEPLLACMTGASFHVGGPGAGHAVKALNNLLSAVGMAITTEAVEIGSRFGIDPERMIEVFNCSSGRNYATEYKFPAFVLQDRFTSGFRLGLQRKDVDTALGLAATCGIVAPVASAAASAWQNAEAALGPDADHTEFARQSPGPAGSGNSSRGGRPIAQ